MKIIASDSIEEALRNVDAIQAQINLILSGQDNDKNGVIDPILGEGGLQAIQALTNELGRVELH